MKDIKQILAVFMVTAVFATVTIAADQRIQYNERMVGNGHPTYPDTLNRLTTVDHNSDGTHKSGIFTGATFTGLVNVESAAATFTTATINTATIGTSSTGTAVISSATVTTLNVTTVNKTGTGKVTNLNCDLLDSYNAATTPTPTSVIISDGIGEIGLPWIPAILTGKDCDSVDGQSRVLTIDADHTHASTGAQGGNIPYTSITGTPTLPSTEAGAADNFLTAYSATTGTFGKARPTWANIDKATSSIADITTRSHTDLTSIGTNTHGDIDNHIAASNPHSGSQPLDSTLTSIASLGTATDKIAYTTGIDTWAEAAITAFGRSLIDDADDTAARSTLGLGTMALQTASTFTGNGSISYIGTLVSGTIPQSLVSGLTTSLSELTLSQLTTKGDLLTRSSSSNIRLGVSGNDGWILSEDSSEPSGLKWASVSTLPAGNADTVDNYHVDATGAANDHVVIFDVSSTKLKTGAAVVTSTPTGTAVPISGSAGTLALGWLPATLTGKDADTVDTFHASQTPVANQVPVLGSGGALALTGGLTVSSSTSTLYTVATGTITSPGALGLTAGGSNQNVTLTPSGAGSSIIGGRYYLGNYGTTAVAQIGMSDASAAYKLEFGKWLVDSSFSPLMTILNNGNVGIGTTSPLAALSIGAGSLADTNVPVQISTGGAGTSKYFGVNYNGNYGLLLGYDYDGVRQGGNIRMVTADPLRLVVNNATDAMDIASTGNATFNYNTGFRGVTNSTAGVHLPAGTTAASTGPLKFTVSGAALVTAPEVGLMEPLNDDLFYTIPTGTARKGFVFNDGTNLTAGRVPIATTNGRLTDDADFRYASDILTAPTVSATAFSIAGAAQGTANGLATLDGSGTLAQNAPSGFTIGGVAAITTAHSSATGTNVHGLGTMSTQNANSVAITGGSATGMSLVSATSVTINGNAALHYGNDQANKPIFMAVVSGQTITCDGTYYQAQFSVEQLDTTASYDTSTSRWSPLVNGYYNISYFLTATNSANDLAKIKTLVKVGGVDKGSYPEQTTTVTGTTYMTLSDTVPVLISGSYVEIWVAIDNLTTGTCSLFQGKFSGHRI